MKKILVISQAIWFHIQKIQESLGILEFIKNTLKLLDTLINVHNSTKFLHCLGSSWAYLQVLAFLVPGTVCSHYTIITTVS